jgi:hypothetical protein
MVQLEFGQIGAVGGQGSRKRLLRNCIIGTNSEQIPKIHIQRPDYEVYWRRCAVIPMTVDENRATN